MLSHATHRFCGPAVTVNGLVDTWDYAYEQSLTRDSDIVALLAALPDGACLPEISHAMGTRHVDPARSLLRLLHKGLVTVADESTPINERLSCWPPDHRSPPGRSAYRPTGAFRTERTSVAFRAPLTNHHADGTLCPPEHKHTSSGKPLHPHCPGRAYTQAICSCGQWRMQQSGKGYVNESRRHLATHQIPAGPLLRDTLGFTMR